MVYRAYFEYSRHSSIPGGADRALTAAARLRLYVTLTALFGGCTAGLIMAYRTFLRPGGPGFPGWGSYWMSWLFGGKRLG